MEQCLPSGYGTVKGEIDSARRRENFFTRITAPDVSAPFYLQKTATQNGYSEYRGEEFRYVEVPMTPIQRIYYGVPGTGKSYTINKMMEERYPDPAVRDAHYRRLIFHPTYSYEDFVGSIKPLMTPDRPLDYMFAPGPLTILLKDAFSAFIS